MFIKKSIMHYNGEHLNFITNKVKQIKTALFKSDINSELLLPNNIIEILQVDADGHIWFFTSCNGRYAKNIKPQFYAYLDFYKKQTGSRLQINGHALVVEDENDSFISISNYSKLVSDSLVLVKMKIVQAEYYDGNAIQNISLKNKIFHTINQLFFNSNPKIFNFG